MGTGSFPGVKSSRDVTLTPYPLLVPWSRKDRAIPLHLILLWALRHVQSLSACASVHFILSTLKFSVLVFRMLHFIHSHYYLCNRNAKFVTVTIVHYHWKKLLRIYHWLGDKNSSHFSGTGISCNDIHKSTLRFQCVSIVQNAVLFVHTQPVTVGLWNPRKQGHIDIASYRWMSLKNGKNFKDL
jgi:hypothetical protein